MFQKVKDATPAEQFVATILPFCFGKHTASRTELHGVFSKGVQHLIDDAVSEAKKLPAYDAEKFYPTVFDLWLDGKVGNFGNFQTTLFKAFQYADLKNRERLTAAFPDWFATKINIWWPDKES